MEPPKREDVAFQQLADDLAQARHFTADSYRVDFLEKLADGDLFNLIENAGREEGIGGRSPVNIAEVIRDGRKEKPMLIEGWIVAGDLHWLSSEPGLAKTWIALWLALQEMEKGGRVIWVDEELGADEIGFRLLLLGADPELIERRFIYFEFPGWGAVDQDPESGGDWSERPVLRWS